MDEFVIVDNVTCSKCGRHKFKKEPVEKGTYVCCEETEDGKLCNNIMYLCKKCNKVYPKSMFGKHGDVFECKECGTVQWAYTDSERSYNETMAKLNSMQKGLDAWKNNFRF